jgi:hypothetical protein
LPIAVCLAQRHRPAEKSIPAQPSPHHPLSHLSHLCIHLLSAWTPPSAMFSSSIRPIARSTFSAARRYSARAPSASASARSTWTRNAFVGAGTLAVGGWALSQRDHVRNDAAPVRESVLDQKTLKEPIHSRDREWYSLCLFIGFPASQWLSVYSVPRSPCYKTKTRDMSRRNGLMLRPKPRLDSRIGD